MSLKNRLMGVQDLARTRVEQAECVFILCNKVVHAILYLKRLSVLMVVSYRIRWKRRKWTPAPFFVRWPLKSIVATFFVSISFEILVTHRFNLMQICAHEDREGYFYHYAAYSGCSVEHHKDSCRLDFTCTNVYSTPADSLCTDQGSQSRSKIHFHHSCYGSSDFQIVCTDELKQVCFVQYPCKQFHVLIHRLTGLACKELPLPRIFDACVKSNHLV